MEAPPRKHALALRSALVLAALAAALPSPAETNLSPLAGVAPLAISFSIDRRLDRSLRPSLEEAVRKLSLTFSPDATVPAPSTVFAQVVNRKPHHEPEENRHKSAREPPGRAVEVGNHDFESAARAC